MPPAALRAALDRQLRRDGLLVCAAGAITPDALKTAIAQLFAGLPAGAPPAIPPLPAFTAFGQQVVPVVSPQSAVVFGQEGFGAEDPDWEAAQVVLRILAGGGFASRLMQSVREQRGLAYGIGGGLDVLFRRGIVVGSVATENARVAETLSVTREEWARMAKDGPTEAERADAVAFMTGSLPLQFTDSRRVADSLLVAAAERPADGLAGRAGGAAEGAADRAAGQGGDAAAAAGGAGGWWRGTSGDVAGQPDGRAISLSLSHGGRGCRGMTGPATRVRATTTPGRRSRRWRGPRARMAARRHSIRPLFAADPDRFRPSPGRPKGCCSTSRRPR